MFEMNEKEIQRRLKMIADFKPSPEATARDLERVRQLLTDAPPAHIERPRKIWRNIMNHPLIKFSVAAAIVVAVLGIYCWTNSGNSLAFADVIKPILIAKTAVFDIVVGTGEQTATIHDEVMGSRIHRTMSIQPDANIVIDLEQMKIFTSDPKDKTAMYVKLEGINAIPNYLQILKDLVQTMQSSGKWKIENQGTKNIDGQDRIVFVATMNDRTVTILVDPETSMPVAITEKTPNMRIASKNLQFDVPLDESRFSMEVPDGYKVIENQKINLKSSESDFIETLRICAEFLDEEKYFPDSINLGDIIKKAPEFGEALKKAKLSEQEQIEIGVRFGQGLGFIRLFKGQGKWYYAGKGVKLGDGTKPIFWYHPKKSKTWRVIYGDLSVKDVDAKDLPKLPGK